MKPSRRPRADSDRSARVAPAETPYEAKTFGDRNPIKRAFQRRRLEDALRLAERVPEAGVIVDYGAGNGELCRLLLARHPRSRVVCFEPHPGLLAQARTKLGGGVRFVSRFEELADLQADLVFCLEVLEHLPPPELEQALERIRRLLGSGGHAVVGVPVETGLPAVYKGLFRMSRRWGEYDAGPRAILAATLGRPPGPRPKVSLFPGAEYHLHHLGFDHRAAERALASRFTIQARLCGPLPWCGDWLNAEVSLLIAPRQPGGQTSGQAA